MTLHEALAKVYARAGITTEYLLLRESVRALTAEQVRKIEQLCEPLDKVPEHV